MGAKIKVIWMRETKPDWMSRLIMWWQEANYSHVGILYKDRLIHAIGEGVVSQEPQDYMHDHVVTLEKDIELTCSEEMLEGYLMGEVGKEYAESQLFYIGISKVLGLLGVAPNLNGDARRICSEFVGVILYHWSEFPMSGNRDFWTPADLAQITMAQEPVK